MKLNILFGEQPDHEMKKGDAYWFVYRGRPFLRIACPNCGVAADDGTHTLKIDPPRFVTIHPYHCFYCDWDSHVIKGKFMGKVEEK